MVDRIKYMACSPPVNTSNVFSFFPDMYAFFEVLTMAGPLLHFVWQHSNYFHIICGIPFCNGIQISRSFFFSATPPPPFLEISQLIDVRTREPMPLYFTVNFVQSAPPSHFGNIGLCRKDAQQEGINHGLFHWDFESNTIFQIDLIQTQMEIFIQFFFNRQNNFQSPQILRSREVKPKRFSLIKRKNTTNLKRSTLGMQNARIKLTNENTHSYF